MEILKISNGIYTHYVRTGAAKMGKEILLTFITNILLYCQMSIFAKFRSGNNPKISFKEIRRLKFL